jgi:hypothetical protein
VTHPRIERFEPRTERALEELRSQIRERYPTAAFEVFRRDDPDGIRLRVTVDVEDTDAVLDTVIDSLYDIQVEQQLPIYVVPVQPFAPEQAVTDASESPHSRIHRSA